jgi:hypothetical protein
MPHHSQLAEAPSNTSYGQVIEYIAGEPLPWSTGSTAAPVVAGRASLQYSSNDVS